MGKNEPGKPIALSSEKIAYAGPDREFAFATAKSAPLYAWLCFGSFYKRNYVNIFTNFFYVSLD
jgi:hypothetical protein